MPESNKTTSPASTVPRPWDARLARKLVTPLKESRVTPNHLTTLRLGVGLAAAAFFLPGTYGWSNIGALLLILSNFLDHTDGELARISGKTSRMGHLYDLASDALITVLLFIAIGVGVGASGWAKTGLMPDVAPPILGALAGCAIALIFFLRMRIEEMAGKMATKQAAVAGFETEDVLYLLPLATLLNGMGPLLVAASIGTPLFAIWVVINYRRVARRRPQPMANQPTSGTA
jgi:phosphatidylglycerophosphate synthase